MIIRIGKVTNIYPDEGKVQVYYEDRKQTSTEIPMLTFNNEYVMPSVGDMVVTLHMEVGSSKAFCLGTYWNAKRLPQTTSKYRKDLGDGAYIEQTNSEVKIYAPALVLSSSAGTVDIAELLDRITELEAKVAALEGGN